MHLPLCLLLFKIFFTLVYFRLLFLFSFTLYPCTYFCQYFHSFTIMAFSKKIREHYQHCSRFTSVREVTRTPDLPLRSGFVTQNSKERRAFPCPDFRCHPLCHPGTGPPLFLSKQIIKCNLAMDNAAVFSSLHTICRDHSSL